MNKIQEGIFNWSTGAFTFAGIATNLDTIKSLILFLLGFIFLCLQIIHQIQKIRGKR
jgi:hypothetical protein